MNTKTYIKYLLGAIAIFVSYHLLMWVFFTSKIFGLDDKTVVGDLARMSYQVNMIQTKHLSYTLPKSFIYDKTYHNQAIDMITIGDSFSHGGGAAQNPYYQDFLATIYDKNILNINPIDYDKYIETAVGLYNSGYLKKHKIKYVLLQSVERFCAIRFQKNVIYKDYSLGDPTISKKVFSVYHQDIPIITTANYKIPYYSLAYLIKENAKKDIHKVKLSKKLFSHSEYMLYLHGDIQNIPQFTKKSVQEINNSINKLAKLLAKDNITLIFMPTSDKYDLYYDYLINNKHPKNPFFDLIRPLKKDYVFIDTKAILTPYLKKGVQDIYFQDDTHWSSKASKAVTENILFQKLLGK